MKRDNMDMVMAFFISLLFFNTHPTPIGKASPFLQKADSPNTVKIPVIDSLNKEYDRIINEGKEINKEALQFQSRTEKVVKETGTLLNYYSKMDKKECIVYYHDTTIIIAVKNRTLWDKIRTLNFKGKEYIKKDTVLKINK